MDSELDLMPDESEQLDQLQADDTLLDRGVADVLEEGYVTPENWSAAEGYGNTAAEMRRGETLEMRLAQEIPDTEPDTTPWRDDPYERREVGRRRAGRLVDANHGWDATDVDSEVYGEDVGIDGGAASAEEAAMHIIDLDDDDFDE
jgi:hypothetical protein